MPAHRRSLLSPVRTIQAFLSVITAMLLAGTASAQQTPREQVEAQEEARAAESLIFARGLSAAFKLAAERIEPAVVHITTREVRQRVGRDLFGRQLRLRPEVRQGLGSGVIVDADRGLVVTNHHVAAQGSELTVRLDDGRSYNAKLLGSDE
ncbi:MAG: trypsin-like peptidase domain-containing protein, partial [Planctomycetota bacterium]